MNICILHFTVCYIILLTNMLQSISSNDIFLGFVFLCYQAIVENSVRDSLDWEKPWPCYLHMCNVNINFVCVINYYVRCHLLLIEIFVLTSGALQILIILFVTSKKIYTWFVECVIFMLKRAYILLILHLRLLLSFLCPWSSHLSKCDIYDWY